MPIVGDTVEIIEILLYDIIESEKDFVVGK